VSTLIRSPRRLWRSASLTAPERDLGDLRAAADDDDPLAEHRSERAREVTDRTSSMASSAATSASSLTPSTSSSISAAADRLRRDGPWPARGCGRRSGRRLGDARERIRAVDDVEADRRGRRPAARRSRGISEACRGRPHRSEVVDRHRVGLHAAGRIVLLERESEPANTSRVAAGSEVVSMSAPSVSSATPTIR
jgi:hypothetical protein